MLEIEYSIKPIGRRVISQFDDITGDVYRVTKFDPANNDITEYEVVVSTFGYECSCPGGRHKDCKHRRMVREFQAKETIK